MKTKSLLLVGIALFAMSSCSSSGDSTPVPEGVEVDGELSLQVSRGQMGAATRVIDSHVNQGTTSEAHSVQLYFLKNNNTNKVVSIVKNLNKEDIKTFIASKYDFTSNGEGITGVASTVNMPLNIEIPTEGTSLPQLKKTILQTTIHKIQPGLESNNLDGIKNAPMFAEASVQKIEESKYKAYLKLTPMIARIQVTGAVAIDEQYVSDLKVTRMFLDNFISDNTTPDKKFTVGKSIGSDLDNKLKSYQDVFEFEEDGIKHFTKGDNKAYAYHVFPQSAPENSELKGLKLVLKLEYKDLVKNENRISYATLKLNRNLGNNTLDGEVLEIESSKLYTIDLGVIDWDGDGKYDKDKDKFKPEYGDETPNGERQNLATIVDISAWESETTIPSA